MKIISITMNGDYPVVTYQSKTGPVTIDTSTLNLGGPGGTQGRLSRFKTILQGYLDDVAPLTDLDPQDPYRMADPGLPGVFWDGKGNVVVRNTLVKDIQLINNKYICSFETVP